MKHAKKLTALALVLVLVLSLAACGAPEKKLLGSWRDTTGGLGYDFHEDGTVTLHFVHFTIPIVNFTVDQDVTGTYTVTKAEDKTNHVTINYQVTLISLSDEFTFEIEKDILRLTNVKTNNVYTLTRADEAVTTSAATTADTTATAG